MKRGLDGKYHILYKTTNMINNKFYIGIHSTRILEDGYLGSGKRIKREIKKYGIKNFTRDILNFYETRDKLLKAEKEIVNEEFRNNELVLNIANGGQGDFSCCNTPEAIENRRYTFKIWSAGGNIAFLKKFNDDKDFRARQLEYRRKASKIGIQKCREKYPEGNWKGLKHSEETKLQMSKTHKKNKHQQGEKNSMYGKMWIYNLETFENTRINKDDIIPEGWIKGRKYKK